MRAGYPRVRKGRKFTPSKWQTWVAERRARMAPDETALRLRAGTAEFRGRLLPRGGLRAAYGRPSGGGLWRLLCEFAFAIGREFIHIKTTLDAVLHFLAVSMSAQALDLFLAGPRWRAAGRRCGSRCGRSLSGRLSLDVSSQRQRRDQRERYEFHRILLRCRKLCANQRQQCKRSRAGEHACLRGGPASSRAARRALQRASNRETWIRVL